MANFRTILLASLHPTDKAAVSAGDRPRLTRRRLLSAVALSGAGLLAARCPRETTTSRKSTHPDRPSADGEHFPSGFTVPAGQTWEVGGLVTSAANIVIEGTLRLRPGATLRFVGIDEEQYVGGHTGTPLDSDVGLWVVGDGVLDARGTPKLAWTRVDHDLEAGDTTIKLPAVPDGWQPGDELVVLPTLRGTWDTHDRIRVADVDGSRITLEDPLTHDHPVFTHPALPQVLGAEVVNLSRDVKIEGVPRLEGGTAGGKAHVMFLHARRPQHVSYVELSHLGPETLDPEDDYKGQPIYQPVLGRYALHFHMCDDGVRGSRMVGLSAHEIGNRSYVTHLSNGVDWVECVAHDTYAPQYWWDQRDDTRGEHPPSHDVRYIRCVGSLRRTYRPVGPSWREPLFSALAGTGNAMIGCVAAGAWGSGFHWPEGSDAVWQFRDCVAHNLRDGGVAGWQNSHERHVLERFVCYRIGTSNSLNGAGGIEHGAYSNCYLYRDALVAECEGPPLGIHAANRNGVLPNLEFNNVVFDASGYAYAVEGRKHRSTRAHVIYNDCTFTGYREAAMAHSYEGEDATAPMRSQIDRYQVSDPDRLSYYSTSARSAQSITTGEHAPSEFVWVTAGTGADLSALAFPAPLTPET